MAKKVLITGATGFVGSHIVDRCLAKGYAVRVLVRESSDLSYLKSLGDPIEYAYGDLEEISAVEKACADIDVIFHAAGRVTDHGSFAQFFHANVIGTRHLLRAAKRHQVPRLVFISSPSIFTDNKDHFDIDESMPYPQRFVNYYAATKAISEQEVLAANGKGLVTCSLRPRGVWGLRDKAGFLPKLLNAMKTGKLKRLAPGKRVMAHLCHVHNFADACLQAAESPHVAGQAYFICDKEPVVVWELLDRVGALFGLPAVKGKVHPLLLKIAIEIVEAIWMLPGMKSRRHPPVSRYSVSLLTLHSTYSIKKAQKDFGYDPRMTLDEGLRELKDWADARGGVDALISKRS